MAGCCHNAPAQVSIIHPKEVDAFKAPATVLETAFLCSKHKLVA